MRRFIHVIILLLLSVCAFSKVMAEESFKLTTGFYRMTGGDQPAGRGMDINLRHTSAYGNVWVGWYRQPDPDASIDITQGRAGWDNTYTLGAWRLQPSIQAASAGFWGGSFGVETGEKWYAGAGIGRTNLRPYVNLNFDPNDSLMASVGYRWSAHQSFGLLWVRDNRENPDQRHLHLIYRTGLSEHERLTLDLLSKAGSVTQDSGDVEKINKLGLSVTYDWHQKFIRLACDPNPNFTTQTMWRLAVGTRF
jgi:hypothetical protein